jgi:hypothetical protein
MRICAVFSPVDRPGRVWLIAAALAYAQLLVSAGCGRGDKPSKASPEAPSLTQTTAPAGNQEPDLAELNRQLRRWIVQNRRPPKNFEDFAATCSYQVPAAPAGKKYQIDSKMHVVLVNR